MPENKPQNVVGLEGFGSHATDEPSGVVTKSYTRELVDTQASLRALSLFSDLSESELTALTGAATLIQLKRDEFIFRAGDVGRCMYVVLQGVVEIVIERASGHPLSLATCEPGEFFGEMALVDGQPRSAAARALCDCRLLAIDRDSLLRVSGPQLASRLTAELSKRLRRADGTLAHLADRVSRAAYANVNSAVSVELEAIKTLHQHTEQIAADTLTRAEARATEVMARADQTTHQVRTQLDSAWTVLKRRIAPLAAVLLLVLSWFGIDSIRSVRARLDDLQKMDDQIKAKSTELAGLVAASQADAARLRTTYVRTRALEETMGELRAVRDAVGLDRELNTPERLRRAALNYEQAKLELRARYLASTDAGPQFEHFEPNVVFEAVDTYVTMVMGGGDDGQLSLSPAERTELLGALSYVLANLPDVGDAVQPGRAQLLYDRRVRDMLAFVAAGADITQKRALITDLTESLTAANVRRTRENLSLSLADLGERTVQSLDVLAEMQRSKRPWRAAFGSMGLAKLGMRRGYEALVESLREDDGAAYPAAALLAELGSPGLSELMRKVHAQDHLPTLRAEIERALRAHQPNNCLEERYARHLLRCVRGSCTNLSSDESCPSFSARR